MKKGIVCFILLAFLFFIFPSSSEELESEIEEPVEIILPVEIENEEIILDEVLDENLDENLDEILDKNLDEILDENLDENLDLDLELDLDSIFSEKSQTNNLEKTKKIENSTKEYNFNIKMSNMAGYSIVALNDAFIDMHIRGSLWIGGTLTSNDWCGTDDGSINNKPSETESYIYDNQSNMYFQGRTENQSKDAYKNLSAAAVESTRDYWTNIINSLPNDGEQWIYVEPDANGYVNLEKWDYQTQGNDESQESIKKVYWTNASKVDMGGLAGHLIAPFADIDITWCNHNGTIIGWNITTHGEAHINYWKPKIPEVPEPTASPAPGKIILQKTLVNDVWHIRCDVMDGTNFHAGGGIWKTDVIMNPTKQTSKEGHRSNKCGDADHWIIWLDNTGTPFRMDEIKSGATGGTLPTMIFEEVYSPQDLGFSGWGELEPEMTDKVELYKENFKIQKDITTVKPGERIYWVTWNGDQRWYHSGIPYVAPPTFTFYIDGEPYPIVAGQYLELEDVLPGAHEIKEDVNTDDYIITVFGSNEVEGTTSIINIVDGETVEVEYVNEIITPPTVQPSTPPSLPTATPTVTIKPTETPTPTSTPTPTEEPTTAPTSTPTPTEEPTHEPTEKPTATPTPSPTPTPVPTSPAPTEPSPIPTITITPTNEPTATPTIRPTDRPIITATPGEPSESPRPRPTPTETIKPTKKPTNEPTKTPILTVKPTKTPTLVTPTPTVSPTPQPTAIRTATPTATPTLTPTKAPTPTPTEVPKTATPKPTKTPSPTPEPTSTPKPTLPPKVIQKIIENLPEPVPNKPDFSQYTEEELEELFDMWGYETPLYGIFQTGDEVPIEIIFAGLIGILCLILYFVLKKHNI